MSKLMSGNNMIAKEICDALGLKHATRLDFHMAVDDIATVTAVFYPEVDGVKQLPAIMKKFKLVPIDDEAIETTEIGDQTKTCGA